MTIVPPSIRRFRLVYGLVVLLTAVAATVAATRPVRKVTAYCLLTE